MFAVLDWLDVCVVPLRRVVLVDVVLPDVAGCELDVVDDRLVVVVVDCGWPDVAGCELDVVDDRLVVVVVDCVWPDVAGCELDVADDLRVAVLLVELPDDVVDADDDCLVAGLEAVELLLVV